MEAETKPTLGPPAPLRTSWREKSRSNRDVVMEEVDAFGTLTGRTRVDILDPLLKIPVPAPEGNVRAEWMPSDPTPHILRTQVPWWKIFLVSGVMVALGELVARIVT